MGGLLSIIIKVALGSFLLYKFTRMTGKNENQYETREYKLDVSGVDQLNFNETKILPYFVFYSTYNFIPM